MLGHRDAALLPPRIARGVNAADEGHRLPPSIGGLLGFALRAWAANAPLYLALQLAVFVAYSVVEVVVPAASPASPQGQFKIWVFTFTGLFADALVVAAAAIGVAARGVAAQTPARVVMGAAIDRWLPVIAVSLLAQSLMFLTSASSGFGPPTDPRILQYVTAPFVWILWGILSLTGPFVALSAERRAFSVIAAFVHAFTTSLHRANLLRLCVLALITLLPNILQVLAYDALVAHHVTRSVFWANYPIDALTVGPISAIQTAFALDFARRARIADEPPVA
jgi:hypothetical protein